MTPEPTIAIAHYRRSKMWLQIAVAILAIMAVAYLTFWSYGGRLIVRSLQSPRVSFLIPMLLFAWIGSFVTLATITLKAKRLVFDNGVAVWIDQGKLIFMRSWYVSVPCDEIAEVSHGMLKTSVLTETEAVALRLRDGSQLMFPTGSLLETRDALIARLSTMLNLAGAKQ